MLKKRLFVLIAIIGALFALPHGMDTSHASTGGVGVGFAIVDTVYQNGEELQSQINNTTGKSFYSLPRTQYSVDVVIRPTALEDGYTYKLVDYNGYNILDRDFTSDDNGKQITISQKPIYTNQYEQYEINAILGFAFTGGKSSLADAQYVYFKSDVFGTDNIVIDSVVQNNIELSKSTTGFITDTLSPVTINFRVENLTIGEAYDISTISESFSGIADSTSKSFSVVFNLSPTKKNSFFSIRDSNHNDALDLYIINTNPSFVEFGKIYIDSVSQDGNNIMPSFEGNEYVYEVNDIKAISIHMHADMANNDVIYNLRVFSCSDGFTSPEYVSFTGAELKNGVEVTGQCYIGEYDNNSIILQAYEIQYAFMPGYFYSWFGDVAYSTKIRIIKNNSIPRISDIKLNYANYPEKTIYYVVDLRYHNQDNPLEMIVKGNNYTDDSEYNITVKLLREANDGERDTEFEKIITVSGYELNSGKRILLDDVVLKLMDESHLIYDANMYSLVVYCDGQTFIKGFDYGYGDYGHLIHDVVLTDSNDELIITQNGGSRPGLGVMTSYEDTVMHIYVNSFPESEEFRYSIIKMPTGSINLSIGEIIDEGVITGEELGTGKISLRAEEFTDYYLLVENDIGIIRWTKIGLSHSDQSWYGIESIGASVNGSTLKISYDFPHYKINVGDTVKYTLYGKNYDESKSYTVKMIPSICGGIFGEYGCRGGFEGDEGVTKIFTGKELNEGDAYFELPYLEDLHNQIVNGPLKYSEVFFSVDEVYMNSPTVYFTYIENEPSFSVKLNSNDTFEDGIDVFVSVDDYENMTDVDGGIAAIIGDVEYDDTKLELIGVEALNDFELVSGDHYVLHNVYGHGAPEGTNILKLTFRNKGLESGESTTVSFTNISGSDGVNDITTADVSKTITYYEAEASIDSDTYTIIDNLISKIATGTLVNIFKNGLELGGHATIRILSVNNVELSSTDKVGTGVKVQLLDRHGEVVSEFTIVIKGDISGDGEITITDLVKAKRHLAGLDNYTGVFQLAGDVSKTGAISITDVVKICRHVAGLEVINQ